MAATLAACAGMASAATATFDFSGNTMPTGSLSFTSGDLRADVTGQGFAGKTGDLHGRMYSIGQYGGGLGICSGRVSATRGDGCEGDNHQIDGRKSEIAMFSFDREVTIESVGFSLIDGNDDFSFRATDGTSAGTYLRKVDPGPDGAPTYRFSEVYSGTTFGFGAQGKKDDFKLRSLTVSYADSPEVSPVPLPAAGLLLLSVFGGMGALRALRRKG